MPRKFNSIEKKKADKLKRKTLRQERYHQRQAAIEADRAAAAKLNAAKAVPASSATQFKEPLTKSLSITPINNTSMERITQKSSIESKGSDDKSANLFLDFVRKLGPKTMMERMQRTWVQQMLDIHYTRSFINSLCEYGESPVDSENPSLFCLNIVRLWIKELLRDIHCDKRPKDDCKLSGFFRMTISAFIQHYLSLFGLSPESCFTCHHLGVDGLPTSVCETSVAAKDIGKHVETRHTLQIWKQGQFKPFSLTLASKFVSLTNQTDVSPLEKGKLTVADFRGISYMEVLRKIDEISQPSALIHPCL